MTLPELALALLSIFVLVVILVPAFQSARQASRRAACARNIEMIGAGWAAYLEENESFPAIPSQPDWRYAGVTFTHLDQTARIDFARPLNRYLSDVWSNPVGDTIFQSPLDQGITDPDGMLGTGERTAYEAFGISYRANIFLLDARRAGIDEERRPLRETEVQVPPETMVVMGAPVWYEVLTQTGRNADWYAVPNAGNMLFLDGSVRFVTIEPGRFDGENVAFAPVPGKVRR